MTSSNTNSYLPAGLPAPQPEADDLSRPYWEGTQNDRLMVQRCNSCRGWQWGPEWICHRCLSFDLGWEEVSTGGRIYSWERSHHPVHAALKGHGAYIAVLVELPQAGNVRMVGNLLGDPEEEISIGALVEGVFEHHELDEVKFSLLQWNRV